MSSNSSPDFTEKEIEDNISNPPPWYAPAGFNRGAVRINFDSSEEEILKKLSNILGFNITSVEVSSSKNGNFNTYKIFCNEILISKLIAHIRNKIVLYEEYFSKKSHPDAVFELIKSNRRTFRLNDPKETSGYDYIIFIGNNDEDIIYYDNANSFSSLDGQKMKYGRLV